MWVGMLLSSRAENHPSVLGRKIVKITTSSVFRTLRSGALLVPLFVFVCIPQSALSDGNGTPGGVAGVAALEVQKRQHRVKSAQTLFTAGSNAMSERSFGEAMDYYKVAFETMPPVPAVADQRRIFFKRYQEAAVEFTKVLVAEAKWAEAESTLVDVMATAKIGNVPDVLIIPDVKKILKELRERDDRYNFALSPRHLRAVEEVQRQLVTAKGYVDLGDYDRAERAYNKALSLDPYNVAARRGLEIVERHKMDYYDAAYDHTRSRQLREVAAGWEMPVPPAAIGGGPIEEVGEVAVGNKVEIEQKLKNLRIPQIEVTQASLTDVLQILTQKSQELDVSEPDPLKKGVNIVIDNSGGIDGQGPSQKLLSLKLANVPLEVALKYATQKVGMKYRIDSFAVTVIPESASDDAALMTRTYIVPPGFISAGGGGAVEAGPADPFAEPVEEGGGLVKRISAKDFLEGNGVKFGEGATANYSAATSKLVVRNTAAQHITVEYLIQSARSSGNKMVQVNVKMISIEQNFLREAGMDWLVGQSNLGSSPRVFVGGGTDGNAFVPTSGADYPFVVPGTGAPIGLQPITAGLRSGDLGTSQGIDALINRANAAPQPARAPGVFSVAGVFTDPQFQTVLRALNQIKSTDMLCDINVLVKPGQIAKIEQAREFIYPTEYDPPEIPNEIGTFVVGGVRFSAPTDELPATPATPTAFETRSLGKVIEVEPTVAADNQTVNVNVIADFSEFAGFINYGSPIRNGNRSLANGEPPVVTENEILMPVFDAIKETTNVSVWDGQTIAIGGLHGESIVASQDKVPFLGDLPVLGRAFRSSTKDSLKRALTIFVSVRLVDPSGTPINNFETPDDLVSRDDYTPPTRSVSPVMSPPAGMPYPAK